MTIPELEALERETAAAHEAAKAALEEARRNPFAECPLPWTPDRRHRVYFLDARESPVSMKADLARTVCLAVNTHDGLVAALREIAEKNGRDPQTVARFALAELERQKEALTSMADSPLRGDGNSGRSDELWLLSST